MVPFLDALQDALAWLAALIVVTFLSWATWVTRAVMANKTRLAVLEESVGRVPTKLDAIDAKLDVMKEGAHAGRERIYQHIDEVRRELKADIKDAGQR